MQCSDDIGRSRCFGVTPDQLWLTRNEFIFNNKLAPPGLLVGKVNCVVMEIERAFADQGGLRRNGVAGGGTHLRWKLLENDWVKVNTDGVV